MRCARVARSAVLVAAVTLLALALSAGCAFGATAVETAHARSVKAATNYTGAKKIAHVTVTGNHKKQCSVISVDVSDLKLTAAKAQQAMDWVYFDGEYFWLDALGEGKYVMDDDDRYAVSLTYTCLWKDTAITKRRKDMERAIKNAQAYAKSAKTHAERIHRLHDWIVNSSDWFYNGDARYKSAYSCLVLGKGDCSAYSLAMGVLLQRAGYTTAVCQNLKMWHQWNMVRIGGKWYHVDTRWDDAWSYNKQYFWPTSICHRWVLVSDSLMKKDEHVGWKTYYHGALTTSLKATTTKYESVNFEKACKTAKSFKVGMFGYKVAGSGKVRVQTVYACQQTSYTIPKTVTYKGKKYTVVGLKASLFKSCTAATKVTLKATKLTKKGLKNALKGSTVKTVKVPKSKKATYKKWLKKSNSGKKVTVK